MLAYDPRDIAEAPDTNGDGVVTQDEFISAAKAKFQALGALVVLLGASLALPFFRGERSRLK